MDDNARAIARARENATAADKPQRSLSNDSKAVTNRVQKVSGRPQTFGPATAPSTKRPKTGGG